MPPPKNQLRGHGDQPCSLYQIGDVQAAFITELMAGGAHRGNIAKSLRRNNVARPLIYPAKEAAVSGARTGPKLRTRASAKIDHKAHF
jgi:hypothetical protein